MPIIEDIAVGQGEIEGRNFATSLAASALGPKSVIRGHGLLPAEISHEEPYHEDYPGEASEPYIAENCESPNPSEVADKAEEALNNEEDPVELSSLTHGGAFYRDPRHNNGNRPNDPGPGGEFEIPIPQLPLCGADFDIVEGEGSFIGIAPPALPETNRAN